tara:strand:- start:1042 stop:1803 length:762 start_codon:yes stop_codon:yes gene_type:complete
MAKFATGKNAYALSDRSGQRYRYRDMRKEWNGLLVGPDEYEPKHPQLGPFRTVSDPQALKDARPPQNLEQQRSTQFGFNPVGLRDFLNLTENNLVAKSAVGEVTLEGVVENIKNVSYNLEGLFATGQVNDLQNVQTNVVTFTMRVQQVGGPPFGTTLNYFLNNSQSTQFNINITKGLTYRFDVSDSTNLGYDLRLWDGSSIFASGVYNSGTDGTSGAFLQITVPQSAPSQLRYGSSGNVNDEPLGGNINVQGA